MEEPVIYHVWFSTKRRKWLLQGEIGKATEELLWRTAREKGIDLIKCGGMVDHMHLLLRVEPECLPETIRILKGGSSHQVFRTFPELKLDAGTNSFWQARYAAKPVDPEALAGVIAYIRTQGQRLAKFDRR